MLTDNSTLFAFGDSFTFGHELSDCPTNFETVPSLKSYSALVAQKLGMDYECCALGGYANNSISRRVIEQIDDIKINDLVLIMWTYPERHEFRFDELGYRSLHPTDKLTPFAREYFQHIDMTTGHIMSETAKDLYIVEKVLTDKNIKFIFIPGVTNLSLEVKNQNYGLLKELNLEHWLFLEKNLGFYQWAKDILKLDFNKKAHPPDQAHSELSELIVKKLNG